MCNDMQSITNSYEAFVVIQANHVMKRSRKEGENTEVERKRNERRDGGGNAQTEK